jgi:hypothetical protein
LDPPVDNNDLRRSPHCEVDNPEHQPNDERQVAQEDRKWPDTATLVALGADPAHGRLTPSDSGSGSGSVSTRMTAHRTSSSFWIDNDSLSRPGSIPDVSRSNTVKSTPNESHSVAAKSVDIDLLIRSTGNKGCDNHRQLELRGIIGRSPCRRRLKWTPMAGVSHAHRRGRRRPRRSSSRTRSITSASLPSLKSLKVASPL